MAGCKVRVMKNFAVRRPAVGCIAWLGPSRFLRNDCVAWDRIMWTKVSLLIRRELVRFVGPMNSPDDKVHARVTRVFGAGMRQKCSVQA